MMGQTPATFPFIIDVLLITRAGNNSLRCIMSLTSFIDLRAELHSSIQSSRQVLLLAAHVILSACQLHRFPKHSAAYFKKMVSECFNRKKKPACCRIPDGPSMKALEQTCRLAGCLLCCCQHSRLRSAHTRGAVPLKGGGSYSQLCLSIPRWSFKRAPGPAERKRQLT